MRSLRLKIADLLELQAPGTSKRVPDVTELTPLILKQFHFLPQPLMITVEGDEVVLEFPEESDAAQAEAARLAQKGAKKAAEGHYTKAIDALQRALKLQPSLHIARRDLAMAFMEIGDTDSATNHLIEVLRLDPTDAWSWVVLGNLYLGPKNDPDTGETFLRKALSLKPDDPWALNSLATAAQKRGDSAEAVKLFEQAIQASPEFANPYLGAAMVHASSQQPDEAQAVLQRLFRMGRAQDIRRQPVFERARQLHIQVQQQLARRDESAMFKCVRNFQAELESLSGYPVKIEEGEFSDNAGARIQMAWTHGRDHHRLITRRGYPPELLCHLEAHELSHLKIETEARADGKNQFFSSTSATMETARAALRAEADKLRRRGTPPETVERLHLTLIKSLCGFLFNCPLDMLIERRLHDAFPVLRPSQFLSLRHMAGEALRANTDTEVLKVTPRKILRATLALNGAYCLFLDDLFEGASAFAEPYRKMENFDTAKRLHQHWTDRVGKCAGGG